MKTHVVKTTPDAPLAEVVDLMDIYQVNSLPVVDAESRLCGYIAEEDICRALSKIWPELNSSDVSAGVMQPPSESSDFSMTTAGQLMRQAVAVSEDADAASALRLLFVNNFTRIPVINADGGVVGTLNRIDILQAIFERTLSGPGA